MRVTEQIQSMATRVGASQTIKDWAFGRYDREHSVFIGLNKENPPEEHQYPLVVFDPGEKKAGNEDQVTEVVITYGLYDDSQSQQLADNTFILPAIMDLEGFRDLVLVEAVDALPEGSIVLDVEDLYDREQPFPHYFIMQTTLTVIRPWQFRENKLI